MRVFIGIVMGFFSGFLIYFLLAFLFVNGQPSGAFVFVTFFGGWTASSILFIRDAQTVAKVASRGFLVGAAEWLLVIPAGMVFSGKALSQKASEMGGLEASDAALAGATIGAGLVSVITGGVAVFMALVCMLGFAISYFLGREMGPETPEATKRCPECAEIIQEAARKCRYCGAVLQNSGVQVE